MRTLEGTGGLLVGIGSLLMTTAGAPADYDGASLEVVHVGAPPGFTTYRVYLNFTDPEDHLIAFSANDSVLPLYFETNIGLLNDGGPFSGLKLEDFAQQPISAAWDSYVTIGADEAAGNDTDYRPGFLGGDGIEAVIVGRTWGMSDNGGWFDSNPGTPELAGDELRVLVAQFTVEEGSDGRSDIILIGTADWQPAPGQLQNDPVHITNVDPIAVACCLPDGSCESTATGLCSAFGGTYDTDVIDCVESLCRSACCGPGGFCTLTSPWECEALGGAFQGIGVACEPGLCPTGACCLQDGTCLEAASFACAVSGGSYQGDGTTCTPGLCTCLGDIDGDGDVGFSDLLRVLAYWGPCPGVPECPEDLDGDGAVDFSDLLIVIEGWGACG